MSARALPLLYLSLGGEMVFIIDQRLKAQSVSSSKKIRVMEDLLKVMLDQSVVKTMFNAGSLYSNDTWRALFDKIAHSSIMKLNTASMNKLYDLMVMAVKYQMTTCKRPQDILLITFNHLDEMRNIILPSVPTSNSMFSPVYDQLKLFYASLSPGTFMNIRSCILQFFKDHKIRVSMFLKDRLQNERGIFRINISGELPIGFNIPGRIKVLPVGNRQADIDEFDCGISHLEVVHELPSYEPCGNRIISLGKNMYACANLCSNQQQPEIIKGDDSACESLVLDPGTKSQIDVLTQLIGLNSNKLTDNNISMFHLDLFDSDAPFEDGDVGERSELSSKGLESPTILKIDASKRKENFHLSKIMEEMSIKTDHEEKDDLFDFPECDPI